MNSVINRCGEIEKKLQILTEKLRNAQGQNAEQLSDAKAGIIGDCGIRKASGIIGDCVITGDIGIYDKDGKVAASSLRPLQKNTG